MFKSQNTVDPTFSPLQNLPVQFVNDKKDLQNTFLAEKLSVLWESLSQISTMTVTALGHNQQ